VSARTQPKKPLNNFAVLALIFGIGGGTLGILFGHLAWRQIRVKGERGKVLALVGLVVGYLVTIGTILVFVAALDLDARLFPSCPSGYCYY
jgi:peptidyl-prolyl cis-trans isomerase B (cyclophilin B)